MDNYLSIEPIPYGLTQSATRANLSWLSKPYYADAVCMRIELLNESGEVLGFKDVHMSMADYLATGTDKLERGAAIMSSNGINLISE